jgi:hypothetical protein
MSEQEYRDMVGKTVLAAPKDGHEFSAVIVGTKPDSDDGFFVVVRDQNDDHFDLDPDEVSQL